jgi:hypothetical protein
MISFSNINKQYDKQLLFVEPGKLIVRSTRTRVVFGA